MKESKAQRNHRAVLIIFERVLSMCQWLEMGKGCSLVQGHRSKLDDVPHRETCSRPLEVLAQGVGTTYAIGALRGGLRG